MKAKGLKSCILAAIAVACLSAPGLARDLPAPLEAAVSKAETAGRGAPRFAFTQRVAFGTQAFAARFDPTRAPDARWTLLEPADPETLSKPAQDAFAELAKDQNADKQVVVDDPRDLIGPGAIGERIEGGLLVYSFEGPDNAQISGDAGDGDEMSAKIGRHLRAEITIDPGASTLVAYRMTAPEAFKPAPVAKITQFDMSLDFAKLGDTGAQHLAAMRQTIAGKALFQSFEEAVDLTIEDVVLVDSALLAPTSKAGAD